MQKERLLNTLTLTSFACAGPLLKVLSQGGEVFVNRSSSALEIILTAVILILLPATLITLFAKLFTLISSKAEIIFLSICDFLLITIGILVIANSSLNYSGKTIIILSCLSALLLICLINQFLFAKKILNLLWPFTLIMIFFFFMSPKIKPMLFSNELPGVNLIKKDNLNTNVAVLIYDEFSLSALMDQFGEIDATRFPNFYNLSKTSYWFKNASSVNVFTPIAVPALLSGLFPKTSSQLPIASQYPLNLFSVLANSHQFYVSEPFTSLCPRALCGDKLKKPFINLLYDLLAIYLNIIVPEDYSSRIPSIEGKWGDFWEQPKKSKRKKGWRPPSSEHSSRLVKFKAALNSWKKDSDRPGLYFAHSLMPHLPIEYLPSGRLYDFPKSKAYVKHQWLADPELRATAYHGYLMQVAAADRMLGEFIQRLKDLGIYENTLLVITADHGMSYQALEYRRGDPNKKEFLDDVLRVPFFIKLPNQATGITSLKNAESIDLLPTVLDFLGIKLDQKLDGSSLFLEKNRDVKQVFLGKHASSKAVVKESNQELVSFPFVENFPLESLNWKKELQSYYPQTKIDPFYMGKVSPELYQQIDLNRFKLLKSKFELNDWKKSENVFKYTFSNDQDTSPSAISGEFEVLEKCSNTDIYLVLNNKIVNVLNLKNVNNHADFFTIISDQHFQLGENNLSFYSLDDCIKN